MCVCLCVFHRLTKRKTMGTWTWDTCSPRPQLVVYLKYLDKPPCHVDFQIAPELPCLKLGLYNEKVLQTVKIMYFHFKKDRNCSDDDKRACEAHVDGGDWTTDPPLVKQICYPLLKPGVDSKSALQAEGLGFYPINRHEPHMLIYHLSKLGSTK